MNDWTLRLLLDQACSRRRPLANKSCCFLFLLALTQMAWASTFKKVDWASKEISKLVQLASHYEEAKLPLALDDLSRFYAEGPSRCRFNPYVAKIQSHLVSELDTDFSKVTSGAVVASKSASVRVEDVQPNDAERIRIISKYINA